MSFNEGDDELTSSHHKSRIIVDNTFLHLEQFRVSSIHGDQFVVCALFYHNAIVHHKNLVAILNRTQPMCYDNGGPVRPQCLDIVHDFQFRLAVQGRRWFVA